MAERARTFIDTNVLAYAHDPSETEKQPVAVDLLESLWDVGTAVISTQVLQEFYVVATRKFDPPMALRSARELVAAYGEWQLVHVDLPMILASSELEERHKLSFWDALIVEAARRAGAKRIVSEDLQPGWRIGGLRIENPFL